MKFLFLCFVFSFLTIAPAHSQKEKDLAYFGNISEEAMNREQAIGIVQSYFNKKLKNSTRHAVIGPETNENIITVNIVEIDGSPFYSLDINRKTGKIINDIQYERQQKIQADLQKKKQEAMERSALRSKYQTASSDETKKATNTKNVKNDNRSTVDKQQPNNIANRRRRRRLSNND